MPLWQCHKQRGFRSGTKYKQLKEDGSEALHKFGFSDSFIDSGIEEYNLWNGPLSDVCRKAKNTHAKDVMYTPTRGELIAENVGLDKAIHQLVIGRHHSLLVTSAVDRKIVGVLRLADVFQLVSDAIKECDI